MSTEPTQSKVVEINNEQAFTPDPVYKLMSIFEDSTAGVAAAAEIIHKYNTAQVDYFGLAMTETLPDKPDTYDPDARF